MTLEDYNSSTSPQPLLAIASCEASDELPDMVWIGEQIQGNVDGYKVLAIVAIIQHWWLQVAGITPMLLVRNARLV
ncbi:hypothetical protein OIU76_018427 [Salix suchowensis]|nr:hypothetical protein OIU76_018427 [Salix suchowensis]